MLEAAIEAVHVAGQIILEKYRRPVEVRVKGLRDLVTEADTAAQEAIVGLLTDRFPGHAILAEEDMGSLDELGEYTWIVDPLDGTTNYAFRLPIFSVSVGLAHRGEPALGVVYDPMRDHLFHAQVGQGAFLNGASLRVAEREEMIGSLVAFDWAREPELREVLLRILNHVAPRVATARALGSAALGPCYVAAGWLDAYFHVRLSPWDAAAAAVIVREAGGQVTGFDGQPWSLSSPRLLAASSVLYPRIAAVISEALALL
ncbi:MAG: inositol monophosphatase [Anaerolineae bacterium]|nr:MAG: inositol monophosphatase [Anaerolineae bacterium]